MIDVDRVAKLNGEDADSVISWVEEQYNQKFSEYFGDLHILSSRISSKSMPITDEELECVLIDLPLKLFSVAEEINRLTLNLEVIKLKNRKTLTDKVKLSKESTAALKKEVAESEMFEERVLELAYSCLLDRIQREVSYSKELIMGAKKVWDSRRKADTSNPVSEIPTPKRPIYT